jgi:hypothetical protein
MPPHTTASPPTTTSEPMAMPSTTKAPRTVPAPHLDSAGTRQAQQHRALLWPCLPLLPPATSTPHRLVGRRCAGRADLHRHHRRRSRRHRCGPSQSHPLAQVGPGPLLGGPAIGFETPSVSFSRTLIWDHWVGQAETTSSRVGNKTRTFLSMCDNNATMGELSCGALSIPPGRGSHVVGGTHGSSGGTFVHR